MLLSSCLVKNLLSYHWSHFYQQLDSLFLQLEFFCLLRRNLAVFLFLGAKIALALLLRVIFFQKSLAQGLELQNPHMPEVLRAHARSVEQFNPHFRETSGLGWCRDLTFFSCATR